MQLSITIYCRFSGRKNSELVNVFYLPFVRYGSSPFIFFTVEHILFHRFVFSVQVTHYIKFFTS